MLWQLLKLALVHAKTALDVVRKTALTELSFQSFFVPRPTLRARHYDLKLLQTQTNCLLHSYIPP
jgi:hypothetical protein